MPSTDERIQPALDAFLSADVDRLRSAIAADPEVVHLRIGGENTMLELATQPQVSPVDEQVVRVLIEAGASLDRALNLAGCWNLADMCRQLLAAGADPKGEEWGLCFSLRASRSGSYLQADPKGGSPTASVGGLAHADASGVAAVEGDPGRVLFSLGVLGEATVDDAAAVDDS
jgi:hypothetical protein